MNRHLPRRLAVAGATLLAAVLLAGCGGSDDGTGNDSGATHTAATPTKAAFNPADVAFVAGMVPHHQQALEMARIAATRAANPQVKELAARISKAQDPEITAMSDWLRQWGQPVPAPGMGHGQHASVPGMMTDQEMKDLMASSGTQFDRMFLQMMIRHHQGAIDMARTHQQQGHHAQARQLAERIAAGQAAEVSQMQALLAKL
ncbi:MAG TPA: DUF305 domain-containing protein [Micromonosporaceae bacterium]|nr:DUF305 domain-containing protein [Micromonosporaceae bacterium]